MSSSIHIMWKGRVFKEILIKLRAGIDNTGFFIPSQMKEIRISTAQFENRSGDKEYNLSVIDTLAGQAAAEGSDVIAFHECSVTGYTFAGNSQTSSCFGNCRAYSRR